jgi:alpha-galactosidase
VNESRAHFAIWAMLAAPLIAGNDLRTMSPDTKSRFNQQRSDRH